MTESFEIRGDSKGFTLIEVLIVVAVLSIIAAIAGVSYTSYFERSRNSDAMADAQRALLAQEAWLADNSAYGANTNTIGFTASNTEITVLFSSTGTNLNVCAKHFRGAEIAGCDSTGCYRQDSTKNSALAACPPATVANDFGVGWTLVQ